MRFKTNFIKALCGRIRKRRVNAMSESDTSDDDEVTKAIARKIVDDARKHRLAIEEDLKKDT